MRTNLPLVSFLINVVGLEDPDEVLNSARLVVVAPVTLDDDACRGSCR